MKIALLNLLSKQVSEPALAQDPTAGNSAQQVPETPFAHMLMEQQTAQEGNPLAQAHAAAQAAGLPVLLLADGSFTHNFDPEALPEGAQFVYPLDGEAQTGGGEGALLGAEAAASLGNGGTGESASGVAQAVHAAAEPQASARAIARVGEVVQSEAGRANNPVIALGTATVSATPTGAVSPAPNTEGTAPDQQGMSSARNVTGEQVAVDKLAPGVPAEAQAPVRGSTPVANVVHLETPQASPAQSGPVTGEPKLVSAVAKAQAAPETAPKAEPQRIASEISLARTVPQGVAIEAEAPPPEVTTAGGKALPSTVAAQPSNAIVPGETRAQVDTLNHVTKAPAQVGQTVPSAESGTQSGSTDPNGSQSRPEAQAKPAPGAQIQASRAEVQVATTGNDKPVTLATRVDHARLAGGQLHSQPVGGATQASSVNPAVADLNTSAVAQESAALPIEGSLTRATLAEAPAAAALALDDAGTGSKPPVTGAAPGTVAISQMESGALAKAITPGDSLDQLQLAERPTLQTAGQSVVKGVRYLAANGGETITVRLVPESLGTMHIVVKSGNDAIEVTLVSANHSVRESLEQHLPALREALGRDGIDVSRVSIVAQSATADTTPGGGPLDRQSAEHGSTREGTHRGADTDRDPADSEPRPYRKPQPEHAGSLDVLV